MIEICLTLISLNLIDKAPQIIDDINRIIPSKSPLLNLRQYRTNPDENENNVSCEINILWSTKHENPCQRIMRDEARSFRDNCLISNEFWTMAEVGAICKNPFVFTFSTSYPSQSHIRAVGISILNLLGINPVGKSPNLTSFDEEEWAFFDDTCKAHRIGFKLSELLQIPNLFRQNECLKYKMVVDCRLINFNIIFITIIAITISLNIFILLKIIQKTHKSVLERRMSFSRTYINMENLN